PLSHRNVCTSAQDVCRSIDLSVDDRCLCMWEQYHIGGLVDLLLAPLLSGGCIITTKGFDAEKFFELLEDRKPTWYQAVPTTLNELVNHAGRSGLECSDSSLRFVRSVAAALAPSLMADVEGLFGVPVIQTFGMTEAGPLVASTSLTEKRKPGSVGRSCGTDIRIFGPEGQPLEQGLDGEVAIRGSNVFAGYEDDEEANKISFRGDWFHTGDTGHIDADGELFLTGRIKQLINRGGEKINPQEVDDALLEHPQVDEAAVFTVPHKTLGEDIAAAVVLKEPISAVALRAYLADRISSFKIPGQITFVDRLPRNPVGKIDRLALASVATAERAKSGHVPPRNEIEAYLVRLWSQELSQDVVGIHDDFSALGGDSLSSMRILIALEEAVEGALPEEIITSFSTIASLAEAMSGAKLRTEISDCASESEKDDTVKSLLEKVTTENEHAENSDEFALDKLRKIKSSNDLRSLQEAMAVYRTPAELGQLITQMDGIVPGSDNQSELTWV
ncbi:MAG: AMP-binding protein, partial [Pseudomonadota bacterium]